MAPWTADQVTALSPDPASLAAARRLFAAWLDAGHHDDALWGQCRGSGAKPYETVVDLSGPAFKCSCPSRKFPCKHALSLLLRWSDGAVPEQDQAAEFAQAWIDSRQKKAESPSGATRVANPQTAIQRTERVTGGMEELDTWLTDQIRTGLAQSDRSLRAFESIAARMVDAQAPGIASTLRRIPYTVATREDWPERLLADYAQLHLLVTAHRRVAELPEALQASVRSHIGYPVSAESVLAQPPVRDRWMVLGIRVSEENSIYTRRAWLRGRDRSRWAVVLDFSYGSPAFPPDLPAPGGLIDADLHFYPGASQLRAKIGERHGSPEPFTTLPSERIDQALNAYAAALGADPWLRSWPLCLGDVAPTATGGKWHVVDDTGIALPITVDDLPPWRLLGVSGGHPITLIGEWTGSGVVPVSAFTAGRVVNL